MTIKTIKQIMETVEAFQTSQIIITAIKLDLFTKLDGNFFSVKELSKSTKLSNKGLERLLTALEYVSLINSKTQNKKKIFSTSKLATKCFGKDGILKNWVKHQASLYSIWNELPKAIKSGKPVLEKTHDIDVESYALGLMESYLLYKKSLHNVINLQSPILDIGGGAGHILIRLLIDNKDLTGYILDRKDITTFTKKQIKKFGLEKRISVISGNALTLQWPKKIRSIIISNVLHGRAEQDSKKIVKNAFLALDKGGQIVINEWIKGSHYDVSLFDLNMLVCSKGEVKTKEEIENIVKWAGFTILKWKKFTHTNWVLLAVK